MSIAGFFNPKTVAVVGASRNEQKIGSIVMANMIAAGFEGTLYPINPKANEIMGYTTYASISALPETPDLVVIAIPAQRVNPVLIECGKRGVNNVVVLSAGYKEMGGEGIALENKLIATAREYSISLLGPNCLGYATLPAKVNATFAEIKSDVGSLHVVSQSGAIASAFFDWAMDMHIGLSSCITLGNKSVVDESDFLEYWNVADTSTGPIALYLESIADGQLFKQHCHALSKKRPLLLLKPGKSDAAQSAMQSHTGSIAGSDSVLEAVCAETGIIRCSTIQELFDCIQYCSRQDAPKGNRIALVTNAGGPGVVTTDLIDDAGLQIAKLSADVEKRLQEILPRASSVHDPVDVLGDAQADRYSQALEVLLQDSDDIDAVLLLLTPQIMTEIEATAQAVSELAKKHNMPIVCSFIGHHHVTEGKEFLHAHGIPCYPYPQRAITVLKKVAKRQQWKQQAGPYHLPILPEKATKKEHTLVSPDELQTFAKKYTLPVLFSQPVLTYNDALSQADILPYPVVLKIEGQHLLHKIDLGLVQTNIRSDNLLKQAYTTLEATLDQARQQSPDATITIQKQIQSPVELLVGIKRDPDFGDILLLGAGGTLANILDDHHIMTLPVSRDTIKQTLQQSKIRPLLSGYRGSAPLAIDKLIDLIESLIALYEGEQSVIEAEINPVMVTEDAAWAVDVKIMV